jgi:hypothetical protein
MRAMKAHTILASTALCWLALLPADTARPGGKEQGPAHGGAFPANYSTRLRRVGATLFDEKIGLTTVFVNELAGSVKGFSQEHYPEGSLIVMEFAQPQRDGEGELLRDARGQPLGGAVDYLAVMRRVAGFGAVYGDARAGEWEFSTYRPDGSVLIAPEAARQCAACHRKAGAERDFVYRIRAWSAP